MNIVRKAETWIQPAKRINIDGQMNLTRKIDPRRWNNIYVYDLNSKKKPGWNTCISANMQVCCGNTLDFNPYSNMLETIKILCQPRNVSHKWVLSSRHQGFVGGKTSRVAKLRGYSFTIDDSFNPLGIFLA